MNHDDNELFHRLETEIRANPSLPALDSVPDQVRSPEWEVPLDDAEVVEGELLPVDQVAAVERFDPDGYRAVMAAKDAARLPILPAWARSATEARSVARWVVRHYTHTAGYHAVRLPKYGGKLLLRSPGGLWKVTSGVTRWTFDSEAAPLRSAAVSSGDIDAYLRLTGVRNDRVKMRLILAAVGAVVLFVTALVVLNMVPEWGAWTLLAALLGALGLVGGNKDKPLLDTAMVTFRARKLSADIVTRAFVAAGLAKPDEGVAFPQPIARDGDGWRAVVDLPYGKTFGDAVKGRERLASGIDIADTQVFLDRDTTSNRRVNMWVADRDPLAVPAGRSPLVGMDQVDFWKPFPFGVDERGNQVAISMLWISLLIGAVPRQGKTFSARLVGLAAALDPFVRLYVFDGKGSPDWRSFAKVAHRCGFGLVVGKDGVDPAERLLNALLELKADAEQRYVRLSELPKSVCPEGKLTPELSRNKSLDMPLTLAIIEEVQEYLLHPEFGKQILDVLVYLTRVAPAVGVSVMCATQKPDDKSCPSILRDQHQARFALRVAAWQVSDTVLGAGSYSEGLDASRLLPSHKGVGILKGMSDTPGIVRTHFANGQDAETILDRARLLRENAGTLTGQAVGEVAATDTTAASTLLEDILAVIPASEAKVWSKTVVERLIELRPDVYGHQADNDNGAKATWLAAALKPFKVATEQVWGQVPGEKGQNLKGIIRDHITLAITDSNRKWKSG
ncbi:hypothetical protein Lfu02_31430 [Longispora fulva]|uniref:S-DNA-T family DNA segregation ATPase FtsK/SpoIIIE n=1 Tax=Longispora fulva TaxID=619741 RepID=A0A8J7KYE7_9ACTN|nr:cell division protein FtsK [Longispora fulva]MBG6139277.1 S-DNA-T family DNA segregation ATPase FtsK/SpoIIIE [Longispora fulva]GIG58771.1 hypothetical protein Lfu02_31430 [Longispora fulva]